MAKIIMGIKLNQRNETAKALQDILTRHGCISTHVLGFTKFRKSPAVNKATFFWNLPLIPKRDHGNEKRN